MGFNKYAKDKMRDPVSAFVVFAFVVAAFLAGSVHEPWADEAQAWLIARDATWYNLFFQLPHGEGHPSLWHLILVFPSTYLSYEFLKYTALFFGTLGVLVFVYCSPFPKLIRVILPFTYFVFFQFTVVSRSYCLFALVIFSIGILYKRRLERPLSYCALIALLAYTHAFGTLISIGLISIYLLDLLKEKSHLPKQVMIRTLTCISIPIGVICFFLFQVFPVHHRTLSTRWYYDLERTLHVLETSLNESFTGITTLSLLILLISIFWFWQRKVLVVYLATITPLLIMFSIKGFNDWHLGLFFLVWMMVLWISFESNVTSRAVSLTPYTRKLILGCIYGVFGFHIYWTGTVTYADYKGNFSCGKAVAELLKHNKIEQRRIYARNFWSIAALPYFEGKTFYNINPDSNFGYWTWFEPDDTEDMEIVAKSEPDAMVWARRPIAKDFDGYVQRKFNGHLYWKDRVKENNHCTVYIREDLFLGDPDLD